MTLAEYNNQKDPVRMPYVELQEDEYQLGLKISLGGGTIGYQQVWIKGYPYEYCLLITSGSTLYTTDEDGNPKKPSCFHIKK